MVCLTILVTLLGGPFLVKSQLSFPGVVNTSQITLQMVVTLLGRLHDVWFTLGTCVRFTTDCCCSVQIFTSLTSTWLRLKVSSLLSRSVLLDKCKNYSPLTLAVGHESEVSGMAKSQPCRGCLKKMASYSSQILRRGIFPRPPLPLAMLLSQVMLLPLCLSIDSLKCL